MFGKFKILVALMGFGLVGCATVGKPNEGGTYRDSILSNMNSAPANFAPAGQDSQGDPTLDPLYQRSQADYHYTMGEAMSLEGQSQKAVDEFKLTLIYDPDSVLVRLRLAAEFVRQGLLTEAIEQSEGAVALNPKSEEARMLLGGLYSSLKMYDQASVQYTEVENLNPGNSDAAIYIGAILAEQKKFDEAVAHFEKVAKTSKDPEKAYYFIGRVRAEQGGPIHYLEAEKAYTTALQKRANYPEAALALAGLMRDKGKDVEATKLLSSFQEKFGPNREVARILGRTYLEKEDYERAFSQLEILEGFERDNLSVRVQLALILIKQEKFEQAVVRLEDILSVSPELDKIRYYLGAVYEELKNGRMAVQNYAVVPPSSPFYLDAVLHSADIMKRQGDLKKAIELVVEAKKLREDIPQFYAYHATLLDDLKEYREAVNMLKRAVDRFPNHAQLRFFLGSMHDRVGEQTETIAEMKKVLEIDGNHVQALNYLAYTYAERGTDLDSAEDLARRALALDPTDGYILDTVGWVLFKKGQTEPALRYLEAAIKAKSDESIIAEHLGDVYFRSQMLEKARFMYQKAAELESDQGKVSKIMSKLAATKTQRDSLQRLPANVKSGP